MCGEEFKGEGAVPEMKNHLAEFCKKYVGHQCDQCWKNYANKWDLNLLMKVKHCSANFSV